MRVKLLYLALSLLLLAWLLIVVAPQVGAQTIVCMGTGCPGSEATSIPLTGRLPLETPTAVEWRVMLPLVEVR
jgi:hypothetical protein